MGELPAQPTFGDQTFQDVLLKQPRQHVGVEPTDREEVSLAVPSPVDDQRVQMRVPVELVSVSLDGDHSSGEGSAADLGLGVLPQSFPGTTGQLPQQTSVTTKCRTQDPGNRPDVLAVSF